MQVHELDDTFEALDAMLEPGATPQVDVFKKLDNILESIPDPVVIRRELTPIEVFNNQLGTNLAEMGVMLEGYFPDNWEIKDLRTEEHNRVLASLLGTANLRPSSPGLVRPAFEIMIRFPEIALSNGSLNHLITNLYHRIQLSYDMKFMSHGVRRGTVTLAEYDANYYYSHAGGARGTVWSGLCLGHTTFANLVTDLSMNEFTIERFEMYLLQLKPYFEWESLAGVPHVSISNVRRHNLVNYIDVYQVHALSDIVIKDKEFIELAPIVKRSLAQRVVITVSDSDELWKIVSKHTPTGFLSPYDAVNQVFVSEETDNNPTKIARINREAVGNINYQFSFKGQTVTYTVVSDTKVDKDAAKLEKRCSRDILLSVTSRLGVLLGLYDTYEIHSRKAGTNPNR